MLQASLFSVFLIELVLTAFLVFIIMGVTNRRAPAGLAPLAIGRTLTAIHLMPIPSLSNASVNPVRSLGSAVFGGTTALSQLWLFWVAPIIGGAIGGALAPGCRRNSPQKRRGGKARPPKKLWRARRGRRCARTGAQRPRHRCFPRHRLPPT